MIAKDLLELLAGPVNRMKVREADTALLERINRAIAAGKLCHRDGRKVEGALEAALVRHDNLCAYPVRQGIPVMLAPEGIELSGL
ncbi:MAG: Trm112 family protein [Planctomycetia bacterium]